MLFKARYRPSQAHTGHVQCRVFISPAPNRTWATLGHLTVRVEEFESMRAAMSGVIFEPEPELKGQVK